MHAIIAAGIVVFASAAVTHTTAAAAAAASQKKCPDVLDYLGWEEAPDQLWDYRSAKATIVGASHSRDPAHEQFARIDSVFADEKPTIVFFEGPDRGTAATAEETIRTAGESGYLRFLAKQAGIAARTLEPSPPEQVKSLLTEFPGDQVFLFFVLREATRLRDREAFTGDALESRVGQLFEKLVPMAAAGGIELPFTDTAGLQQAFARYWPGRDWKTADARWFSPGEDDEKTGGVFAAAINRADSTNRNRHLVQLLSNAVASGEKPLVVVGRNHVPMVVPALDCALKD